MIRLFTLILLSSISLHTHSQSVLPQAESNGEDGFFSINTDTSLFADADNIYNFADFSITDNATLHILSDSAVYIYSQQSITVDGTIFADTPELHLIAPEITGFNLNLNSSGSINLYLLGSVATEPSPGTGSGGVVIISNPGISPVPVPAAIWLFASGLLSLLLARRRSV